MSSPSADLLRAALFAAAKHRSQKRKDAAASPYVLAVVLEVSDDKSLPKEDRKRLQIEKAPGISDRAKLVKLGDKICNVLDVASNPPAGWSLERRRAYLDWTEAVVEGCRGASPELERHYDGVLEGARAALGDASV